MKSASKKVGLTIGAIVVAVGVFLGIMYGTGWLQRLTADFRGETAQIERVQADPNFRIAAYEQFYDRAGRIEALEEQICLMKEAELPEGQVSVNVLALSNQRIDLIKKYEADASKEDTRANFLASDLPYTIDTEVNCK